MLTQDIREDRENIIRITEYKNFFLRDSITLYFKHDDAELETLINIQLGCSFRISNSCIYYAEQILA